MVLAFGKPCVSTSLVETRAGLRRTHPKTTAPRKPPRAFQICYSQVAVALSLSCVRLHDSWTAAGWVSLAFTVSRSLLRFMSTELVMPYNHLILCCPLLLLPSIFPSTRVFSGEPAVCIPGGSEGKASACDAQDPGSIPESGRSLEEGNGNPLQYSCLENPMDRGAWWATVQWVTKSRTGLSDYTLTLSQRIAVSVQLLIPCCPLLLLPSIFPSIRVLSNELALRIRWPKDCNFSISPPNEHPGLISFRMDWLDLLAVQGTLKSLLQHHSSKASILWHSAFFMV